MNSGSQLLLILARVNNLNLSFLLQAPEVKNKNKPEIRNKNYNNFFLAVPAKIASFDDTFTATYKEDVKLPCLAVGMPAPELQWKVKGTIFQQNDRMRQLPEGSLLIKEVTRGDAGEYSCYVENSFGHDTVTHQLVVHGTKI